MVVGPTRRARSGSQDRNQSASVPPAREHAKMRNHVWDGPWGLSSARWYWARELKSDSGTDMGEKAASMRGSRRPKQISKQAPTSRAPGSVLGRSAPLPRGTLTGAGRSALGAFGHLQGVIHLDAKVFHGALKLAMAKQELHGPQVLRTPVDQRRLGPAQRMGAVLLRIPADESYPSLHDPSILP